MNASWNAVVNDISTKIKEQEEERIAQDEENASLRAELEVCRASWVSGATVVHASLRCSCTAVAFIVFELCSTLPTAVLLMCLSRCC